MVEPILLSLWVTVAGFGLVLAAVALRVARGRWMRLLVVALVVALAGSTYAVGERVLGHARPIGFEIVRPGEDARVLYAQAVQGKGIFLLVAAGDVPTYYRLPWDERTAKELRKATEAARDGQLALMFRFEPSLDDREPLFYAMPQPAPPEKEPPEPGLEYRDPIWSI